MPAHSVWPCLVLAAIPAAAPRAKMIAAKLEAHYRNAQTLKATFLERYLENDQLLRAEAGTAYFRRPGKMRWDYERPEKNTFLVDGKTAWFYVPADHTVTRAPAKQSTDWRTPLALLTGEMKLSRICARLETSSTEQPQAASNVVLECPLRGDDKTPKSQPGGASSDQAKDYDDVVFLEVSPEGELARVLFRQRGGVAVEFKFADWQLNAPLPDSLFHFNVPLGVAIVNGELPEGSTP